MKNFITATFTTLVITACVGSPAFSQGTASQEINKHPYSFALEYCKDRGGLARFTVTGSTVKFSCVDDLSKVITITR